MRKFIILSIILCCLTGCNSGYLKNTCIKEETSGSLKSTTTYTIGFKQDNIDNIDITYDYQDTNNSTISSLKLSTETLNRNLNPTYEILLEEDNHYQIIYHIASDSKEEIKEYFGYKEKRSKLVNELKGQGFTCK